jgi:hypothetical protein
VRRSSALSESSHPASHVSVELSLCRAAVEEEKAELSSSSLRCCSRIVVLPLALPSCCLCLSALLMSGGGEDR